MFRLHAKIYTPLGTFSGWVGEPAMYEDVVNGRNTIQSNLSKFTSFTVENPDEDYTIASEVLKNSVVVFSIHSM